MTLEQNTLTSRDHLLDQRESSDSDREERFFTASADFNYVDCVSTSILHRVAHQRKADFFYFTKLSPVEELGYSEKCKELS